MRRDFLASEHCWPAEGIVDGPLILVVLLYANPALAIALHGLIDQLARSVRLALRGLAVADRGQLALELLELELQLAQRLCDLLVHVP